MKYFEKYSEKLIDPEDLADKKLVEGFKEFEKTLNKFKKSLKIGAVGVAGVGLGGLYLRNKKNNK